MKAKNSNKRRKQQDKDRDIVGGQAVIEGVMMVNKGNVAIAVRAPNKKIVYKTKKLKEKNRFFKLPFIRGIVNLVQMLTLGMSALNYSANISIDEDDKEMAWYEILIFTIISLGFGLAIFKFLPLFLSTLLTKSIGSNFLFNLVDGLIKISFFVIYIYLISLLSDIRRLFEYHGAEHKTIHCKEAGLDLTVKNVKKFSTLHPRCGTAFIFLVFTISIFIYLFIPFDATIFQKFLYRISLLPIIASISYELLKLSAKHENNKILTTFIYPGLLLQKLTTREPDNKQMEVAIGAVKKVLVLEKKN